MGNKIDTSFAWYNKLIVKDDKKYTSWNTGIRQTWTVWLKFNCNSKNLWWHTFNEHRLCTSLMRSLEVLHQIGEQSCGRPFSAFIRRSRTVLDFFRENVWYFWTCSLAITIFRVWMKHVYFTELLVNLKMEVFTDSNYSLTRI